MDTRRAASKRIPHAWYVKPVHELYPRSDHSGRHGGDVQVDLSIGCQCHTG
jgi:hypothetical protein